MAVDSINNNTATQQQIDQVIDMLEKLLPAIGDRIADVYQAIKNIIAALSANAGTPQEQMTRLQALDAQVDTAFEAAAAQSDPDLPGGDPLAPPATA